jgi:bacillithiol synthase
MTPIREAIAAERLPGVTALYRDFAGGRGGAVQAATGGFVSGAPAWSEALARPGRVDEELVAAIVERNQSLGASPRILDALPGLARGTTRAVITGQQPGVAGGPLMTLHKIATAVALAGAVEARHGIRCVPMFWIGSDDTDFDEIRHLTAVSGDLSVVAASLPASAYAPGMRVGDIGAAEVHAVFEAVAPFLPGETGTHETIRSWIAGAGDLGDAAARVALHLAAGDVAIVDARESRLRTCARDLLLAFFDREDEIRGLVVAEGRRLDAAGYHAQLDPGDSSGVFLWADGARRKIPPAQRASARALLERDITQASPGVVARNLLQDAVFDPLAVVLGPAEIAYRAQLAGAYAALGVPRPVVFPRMAATFVPPPAAELVRSGAVAAEAFVLDAASVPDAVRMRLRDERFAGAVRDAEAAFADLARGFTAAVAERLEAREREKLEKRLADVGQRLRQALDAAAERDARGVAARFPFLARLPEVFARGGAAQERYLAMIVPFTFHGAAAWPLVRSLAEECAEWALDGRVVHRVYSA